MDTDEKPALCTTNGKPVAEVRANQKNETGQHDGYIVLCPDERAKGFVRPYRDSYKHVGRRIERCEATQRTPEDENPHQCVLPYPHNGDHQFDALMILEPIKFMHGRKGGCGAITTMGRALSETYARQFDFYSHTFCVNCNKHLPVAEFVWTLDGAPVGS